MRLLPPWFIAGTLAGLMSAAGLVAAQPFPSKPVRMVAAMAAGGGADLNARRLAERLGRAWKQPVVVQNIAGSAGNLAAATVADATPDGYTILFASHPIFAVNPVLYEKLPFRPDQDFAPVTLASRTPHVLLMNASVPAARLADLIVHAKERPGALHFGSGGPGTSIHLAGELLKGTAGIDLRHVPYRGAAPAVTALIGNEIQLLFDSSMTAIGHVRGGRVRGLAIASLRRSPALPDVPTFDESGLPGFEAGVAHGILAPARTDAPTLAVLGRTLNAVLADAEYRRQMAEFGVDLAGGSPADFQAYLAAERRKWADVIRRQGIKAQ